jgi:hypothetical protein
MKLKLSLMILTLAAAPAFAMDAARTQAAKVVPLKGGDTLYVFENGKMAKENRFGRPTYLQQGEVLETQDGQKITAVGNEIARLSSLSKLGHHN